MATLARIAGTVTVNGAAAVRKVIVVSDSPSPTVLGFDTSAPDGSFEIEYAGWNGPVFALSLDEYGNKFAALTPLVVGNIIHPTIPNGYVYAVTADGTSGASEPDWPTSGSIQTGSVTLAAQPFYRPIASGPVQGDIIDDTPLDEDKYFKNVVSLLHFNAANNSTVFADQRGSSWSKTGNVVISTTKSRFGSSSARFNAGRIYAVSNDFALSRLSLMTVEFWVNLDSINAIPHLFVMGYAESSRIALGVGGGSLFFWTKSNSSNSGVRISGPLLTVGQDYFVALTKSGDDWELFVNGVSYGVANTSIYPLGSGMEVTLGTQPWFGLADDYLYGFIDDFRMTAWINRHEDGCTVPTAQFPDQGPE